ncbi:MAG TPA: glutamate racemase [Aggregatilineaceae bacterium]|nr:glutamate racemase [Aggregatilineaceae bacterium]
MNRQNAIGVLDSGVGGLSVLREMIAQLPHEDILYVADQANVPYGPRTIEQVREFVVGITRFLMAQDVKLIVVACNAASAAALYTVRDLFPAMSIVGMEPAVKPAAEQSQTGVIGVLATQATFQGELYASVVGRFAHGMQVEKRACPEWVLLAEAGDTNSPAAYDSVRRCITPLVEAGADQLVLGCTHFPFLKATIQDVAGPGVTIVDPSAAVARQVGRVLDDHDLRQPDDHTGHVIYTSSGETGAFQRVLGALVGAQIADAADVRGVRWENGQLDWAK